MSRGKVLSDDVKKNLRCYKCATIYLLYFILVLSLWTTMINNMNWKFSDVAYEILVLVVVSIIGMYSNVENNFSVFHLRLFKITKQRLTSILIGLFFPFVFILYKMITNESIMEYVRDISLHNFITLIVFLIPLVLFITLIIYYGYLVVEKRPKKRYYPEYKEETEISLDNYKYLSLNLTTFITLFSIWIKVSFNTEWTFDVITTEIVVLIIIFIMKILGNVRNNLKWNYSEKLKLDPYFLLSLSVPYLVGIFVVLMSREFRLKLMILGFNKVISFIVYVLPLFMICALVISYIMREFSKIDFKLAFNSSNKKVLTKKSSIRRENIMLSLALTIIFIQLSYVYILTTIVTELTVELFLQMCVIFIPLGVVFYLIIYYSLKDINK